MSGNNGTPYLSPEMHKLLAALPQRLDSTAELIRLAAAVDRLTVAFQELSAALRPATSSLILLGQEVEKDYRKLEKGRQP